MGFHGRTRSPRKNLRRTQSRVGFRCRSYSSLWGQLGLAANLRARSQSFEKLSASDRGYSKAKVAQKDVLFSTAESKDLTLQADSSTGSAPETSRIFNLAFLSGSTRTRTHSKNRAKTSQRYLKFFLRLIMVDRSEDVEGHTRTRERMAHGNVYALVRRPDRVCVSLFRPYRDQRLSVYAVAS